MRRRQPQNLPARDQRGELGTGGQQLADHRSRVYDLLEVVQDQERGATLRHQLDEQRRQLLAASGLHSTQRSGDRGGHQIGVPDGGQGDEQDPAREGALELPRHLDDESSLAATARPAHGHEAYAVLENQVLDLVELVTTADEAVGGSG